MYCLDIHSDISFVVIHKFSFYYFLNFNICKMIIWQILRDLLQFYPSFDRKTCYFCTITFSFEKEQMLY